MHLSRVSKIAFLKLIFLLSLSSLPVIASSGQPAEEGGVDPNTNTESLSSYLSRLMNVFDSSEEGEEGRGGVHDSLKDTIRTLAELNQKNKEEGKFYIQNAGDVIKVIRQFLYGSGSNDHDGSRHNVSPYDVVYGEHGVLSNHSLGVQTIPGEQSRTPIETHTLKTLNEHTGDSLGLYAKESFAHYEIATTKPREILLARQDTVRPSHVVADGTSGGPTFAGPSGEFEERLTIHPTVILVGQTRGLDFSLERVYNVGTQDRPNIITETIEGVHYPIDWTGESKWAISGKVFAENVGWRPTVVIDVPYLPGGIDGHGFEVEFLQIIDLGTRLGR